MITFLTKTKARALFSLALVSSSLIGVNALAEESADPSAAYIPLQTGYRAAANRPGNNVSSSSFGDDLTLGPTGGIWQQGALLGDMGGIRPFLGQYGIALNIVETSEVLGNTTGGVKQSATYDGLTTIDVTMDTQKAFGWKGGLFNVSALNSHGTNLSAQNLYNLQTASGIEADRATRIWEAWYQQSFWYNQADIKVGQQSLDQEFMGSQYAGLFVNTMFGWPMLPSADLPSGGPAYPLSSLGARIRLQPTGPWSLLAGIFDDNPSGANFGEDSQILDPHGTNFRVNDSPLFIAEIQFARPAMGDLEYNNGSSPLPGVYKLGMWYDSGKFYDQHIGTDGLSLADPASNGMPLSHRGDLSIYGVVDQTIWRESPESEESVGAFLRIMGAPGDRNLVNFSLNAGLNWREPFEHRDDDVVGLGIGYASVSNSASSLDRDSNFFNGTNAPIRSDETFIELTYQYAFAPWIVIQPDFQYIFNPGGGLVNPNDPTGNARINDEAVAGIRTNITF